MKTMNVMSRRLLAALLALLLAFPLFGQLLPRAAAAGGVLEDGVYAILTYSDTSRAVNVQYAAGSGGKLVIDGYNGESNELFTLTNRGDGYVTLSPRHAPQCCIAAGNLDEQLTIRNAGAVTDQVLWKVIANGDGTYTFQNKADGRVMDVAHGSPEVGNRVLSYTRNGYAAAQSYHMSRVSTGGGAPSTRASISEGYYALLLTADRSKCVNVQYASTTVDRAACVVDTYNGEANEVFHIVPRGNNLYTIHPKHAEQLCLNALLANPVPGYQITLHNYEAGDEASLWELYRVDGAYSFRNYKTKLMLDDYCNGTQDGNKLIAWTYNGDTAQQFYLQAQGGGTQVSARQQAMASAALSCLGSTGYSGYCQKFVRVVGQSIGLPAGNAPSALAACSMWRVSASMDNIPVGAAVYLRSKNTSSAGYTYGHVGIYVGDGYVVHAQATVKRQTLSSMLSSYNYLGWGWQAGVDLR